MLLRDFIDRGVLEGEPACIESGSCLYRQGEEAACCYLLIEGSVALVDVTSGIDKQVMAPPDILLGIMDLLNETYSFTAFALEPTKLIKLRKKDIELVLYTDPVLRLYLLKMMSYETSLTNTTFE